MTLNEWPYCTYHWIIYSYIFVTILYWYTFSPWNIVRNVQCIVYDILLIVLCVLFKAYKVYICRVAITFFHEKWTKWTLIVLEWTFFLDVLICRYIFFINTESIGTKQNNIIYIKYKQYVQYLSKLVNTFDSYCTLQYTFDKNDLKSCYL